MSGRSTGATDADALQQRILKAVEAVLIVGLKQMREITTEERIVSVSDLRAVALAATAYIEDEVVQHIRFRESGAHNNVDPNWYATWTQEAMDRIAGLIPGLSDAIDRIQTAIGDAP